MVAVTLYLETTFRHLTGVTKENHTNVNRYSCGAVPVSVPNGHLQHICQNAHLLSQLFWRLSSTKGLQNMGFEIIVHLEGTKITFTQERCKC
jgi:hypothetical protein